MLVAGGGCPVERLQLTQRVIFACSMSDADMAAQVRKLKKAGFDLRTATGDDISEEDYAREHEEVRLRISDELQAAVEGLLHYICTSDVRSHLGGKTNKPTPSTQLTALNKAKLEWRSDACSTDTLFVRIPG